MVTKTKHQEWFGKARFGKAAGHNGGDARDAETGKDEMRATAVTTRFLETAEVLKDNAWQRWQKGTPDLDLPIVSCITCLVLINL